MVNLPVEDIRLLIKILAAIVSLLIVADFALIVGHHPESGALTSMASTALGGLIGLLVNPNAETKTHSQSVTLTTATTPELTSPEKDPQ